MHSSLWQPLKVVDSLYGEFQSAFLRVSRDPSSWRLIFRTLALFLFWLGLKLSVLTYENRKASWHRQAVTEGTCQSAPNEASSCAGTCAHCARCAARGLGSPSHGEVCAALRGRSGTKALKCSNAFSTHMMKTNGGFCLPFKTI